MSNIAQSTAQFMREVKVELSKVVWPSREDTMTGAMAVGVFVLFTTIFLAGTDYLIAALIKLVLE